MKTFALSDIHGRTLNMGMFEAKGFDIDNPEHHIVLMGDYFDRHDKNREVLEFIIALKEQLPERVHLLIGNHDGFMMESIDYILEHSHEKIVTDDVFLPRWLRNGGEITIQQLIGNILTAPTLTDSHRENLLKLQKFTHSLEDYFETDSSIFTHAAIDEARNIDYWDRTPIISENTLGKDLYIGHTTFPDALEMYPHLEYFENETKKYLYNPDLDNHVYMIDNDKGNNIIVVEEK